VKRLREDVDRLHHADRMAMSREAREVARECGGIARHVDDAARLPRDDRVDLEWLVAVVRNKNGEIFFYDTGGDIIEDLGTLEYLKERIARAHFGDEPE
jgi:hypothetical protein